MEIKSTTNGFFREIRSIEVYHSKDIDFLDQKNKVVPTIKPVTVFSDLVPEDFARNINLKYNNDNAYFEVDITTGIYLSDYLIPSIFDVFGKRKFAVALVTNNDKIFIGNNREPMSIDLHDRIKDDNSGSDKYEVSIYGTTILDPRFVL
ncbi:hypothetical protein [Riemerella columbipharyngis]|uniref:Uncharacterized protein n=1 Tax=Riemerella columbipharyngis TaxID=1071918 RepID=A0A1G7EYW7_9FLAO|nr:hypothetical protein [Riemerella columbipharyngis]SDE68565.1 hypothetical protein SAMN05421544_11819 [Riemerella columbipharyngis]